MKKKGISLIVLVVTIIVLIILTTTVIISIVNNSPVGESKEACFKTNVDAYKSQLNKSIFDQYFNNHDFQIVTYDFPVWSGVGDGSATIKECIPCITDEDAKKFAVVDGSLVYVGSEQNEIQWLAEMGSGEVN